MVGGLDDGRRNSGGFAGGKGGSDRVHDWWAGVGVSAQLQAL